MAYQPKSYRKFIATSLSAAVVASAGVGAVQVNEAKAADSFTDVSNDYWASGSIQRLNEKDIINGYTDGTYGPGDDINRGQVSELLVRAFGLEVDENAEAPFEDLSDESYYTPYAAAVSEAGYIKGREDNTQFAAGMDLSREQLASILVRAFELEDKGVDAEVNDLDEAHESHQGSIEILAQYGITSTADGNFDPKETVNRAQFAVFLERALGVQAEQEAGISSVNVVDNTTIEVDFEGELSEGDVSAEDFSFDPELEVLDVSVETAEVEASDTVTTVTLTTAEQVEGENYTLQYKGERTNTTVEGAPEPDVLEVDSVSAINLKQIEVEFNSDELNAEDVEDTDNYTIVDSDDNDISVDNVNVDGSTATLTLTNAAQNQDEYDVTVDQDAFGGEEDFEGSVEFFDTTIPEVTGAEVVGSKTIKVNFSEPINTDVDGDGNVDADLKDAFQLNDGAQFVKGVTFLNNNTQANVEFYTDLEEGTQTISVSNDLEDYAGYSVISADLEVEVVEDTEAPEIVGVQDVSPNKATLVFNEDIESGVTASDFYHTNTGETADSATVVDGNTVELTFTDANALPNGTAYIYVEKEAVTDLWGNTNEQQLRVAADVEADETAPSIQKVEASAQNELTVTYDEDVDKDTGSYTLLDEDGEEVDIVGNVNYKVEDGETLNDTLVISLDENVYGDHTLVAEDVEDTVGNALDSQEVDFFVEDETKPLFTDFSSTLYQDGEATEILVVDFDEEMSVTGEYSVLDLEKYIINGQSLADADSADITATDQNTKVRIEVKKSDLDITDGADALEIGRVADAAGNATAALSGSVDIDSASTVGVDSVEAVANNKIEVTLDDIVSDFDADDFNLTAGTTDLRDPDGDGDDTDSVVTGASIDNSGSKSVITFNLADDTLTDEGYYDDGNSNLVTVSTVSQTDVDTANEFGEKVQFSETAEDKIAGGLVMYDDDNDASTDDVEKITADQGSVTLYFTEDIDANTVSALSFDVQGENVNSATVDNSTDVDGDGTNDNTIKLTLEDNLAKPEVGDTVTQNVDIKDSNGNLISDLSADITEFDDNVAVAPTFDTLDSVVNASEAGSVTISGTAEAGATVAVAVNEDSDNDFTTSAVTDSVTVDEDGNWATTLDVTSLTDGTIAVAAEITDDNSGNNNSSSQSTDSFTLDTTADSVSIGSTNSATDLDVTSSENLSDVTITDQQNISETVSVSFDASSDATAASFAVTNAGATDGESFDFKVTDANGNEQVYAATYTASSGTWAIQAQ